MFGQKNFASIYAINSLAGAAASIGVASQMAGALYDEHAHEDKSDPGEIRHLYLHLRVRTSGPATQGRRSW